MPKQSTLTNRQIVMKVNRFLKTHNYGFTKAKSVGDNFVIDNLLWPETASNLMTNIIGLSFEHLSNSTCKVKSKQ